MSETVLSVDERIIELEGARYSQLKRTRLIETRAPDGKLEHSQAIDYSFDGGSTWSPEMAKAFLNARNAGSLVKIEFETSQGSPYEAFLVGLHMEIKALVPGESLILARTETEVIVTKQKAVLACRGSDVSDIDLDIEEGA